MSGTRVLTTAEGREALRTGHIPQPKDSMRLLSKAEAKIAKARPDLEGKLFAQIKLAGLPLPATQHRFLEGRRYAFDFAWIAPRVACEVEGGIWGKGAEQGAHTRGKHFLSDAAKYNEAGILGWLVIRVATNHITDGQALGWIERALEARAA